MRILITGSNGLLGQKLVAPFTLENGLLTQTLKQRRDRIMARDGAAVEAIYDGSIRVG